MSRRRNPDGVDVRVDVDDAHKGELFGVARAYVGHHLVGVAPFSALKSGTYTGGRQVLRVGIVRVEDGYRRRGIGLALLRALRTELGASKVELGYETSREGTLLAKAYKRSLLPRGNPYRLGSPTSRALALAKKEHAKSRALAAVLRDVKRLPISRGMIRGSFVEVVCPKCFARAVVEPGLGVDVEHKRPGCDGRPYIAEIHTRKPK